MCGNPASDPAGAGPAADNSGPAGGNGIDSWGNPNPDNFGPGTNVGTTPGKGPDAGDQLGNPNPNAHTDDPLANTSYQDKVGLRATAGIRTKNGFMSRSLKDLDDEIVDEYDGFFGGINAATSKARGKAISIEDRFKDFVGIDNPGGFSKSNAASLAVGLLGIANPFAGAIAGGVKGLANGNLVEAALSVATMGRGNFGLAAKGLRAVKGIPQGIDGITSWADEELGTNIATNLGSIDGWAGTKGTNFSFGTSGKTPAPKGQEFNGDDTFTMMAKAAPTSKPKATVKEKEAYTYTPRSFSSLNVRRAGLSRIS